MGTLSRAIIFGTLAGSSVFLGVVVTYPVLEEYGLPYLRQGGGGLNFLWLGVLPCLISAAVAARISRTGAARSFGGVILGLAGGALVSWGMFGVLAGMQGMNPLIFSGPLCAAVIAAAICAGQRNSAPLHPE